jgi:phosphoenolpyruvate carboxykinase (ATP)
MPRHPSIYGNLLKQRIAEGSVDCWLVNTGWTGGKYGVGTRMPIKATRSLLNAALDGTLKKGEFRKDPNFGFDVPLELPGCTELLDPRGTWANPAEYDAMAAKLVDLFVENFRQFADSVDEGVRQAAPKVTGQARQQAQVQPAQTTSA